MGNLQEDGSMAWAGSSGHGVRSHRQHRRVVGHASHGAVAACVHRR